MSVAQEEYNESIPLRDTPTFLAYRLANPASITVGLSSWYGAVDLLVGSNGSDPYIQMVVGIDRNQPGSESQRLLRGLADGAVTVITKHSDEFIQWGEDSKFLAGPTAGRALACAMVWESKAWDADEHYFIDAPARQTPLSADMYFPVIAQAMFRISGTDFGAQTRIMQYVHDALLDMAGKGDIDPSAVEEYTRQLLVEFLAQSLASGGGESESIRGWLVRINDMLFLNANAGLRVVSNLVDTVLTHPYDVPDPSWMVNKAISYYDWHLNEDSSYMTALIGLMDKVDYRFQTTIEDIILDQEIFHKHEFKQYYEMALNSDTVEDRVAAQTLLRFLAIHNNTRPEMQIKTVIHQFRLGFMDDDTAVRKAALRSATLVAEHGNADETLKSKLRDEILTTLRKYDDVQDMYPELIVQPNPVFGIALLSALIHGPHTPKLLNDAKTVFAETLSRWIGGEYMTPKLIYEFKEMLESMGNHLSEPYVRKIQKLLDEAYAQYHSS